jgi:Tfp pilus assembly protein PilX
LWKERRMRPENGLASIIIVGVMVILLTLISLGFANIVDRHLRNSISHQLSVGATYAAQSGINDALNYLKTIDSTATASKCGDLIGTASSPGPLYSTSNISGDSDRTVSYNCVLISQHPTSLTFGGIPA